MSTRENDHPNVILRPPLIFLGFVLLGLALDYAWPLPVLPGAARYAAGPALVALGLVVMVAAIRRFRNAGTDHRTSRPATAIVSVGLYGISRNPIYLGMALLYTGIGIAVDSLWVLGLLVPLLVVIRYGVIAREEAYLEGKFGEAYLDYKASVRRWL